MKSPKILTFLCSFLTVVVVVAIIFVFVFLLWEIPKRRIASLEDPFTQKERIELENDTRKTWAQIFAGVFFLITAYFTWRRVAAVEKNVVVAQEGQITDRFSKAIDQLGDKEHIEVRLGGIYALERIAKDSPKDHWPIMEVLTSYVRVNSPWRGKANQGEKKRKSGVEEASDSKESLRSSTDRAKPADDIQAILIILGRRTLAHEEKQDWKLNLRETDLQGLWLLGSETHLEGVDLWGAHLEKAILREVHLERSRLWGAHLQRADLPLVHLEGAVLSDAHLEGADFFCAHLEGADLARAHMERALLVGAQLKEANLSNAHLKRAELFEACLEGAILVEADLRKAENLTLEQLSKVKTLYNAKLDPELMEQIKKDYPHLLEWH